MATDMTVANTILEQLGGARFRVMTGAKDFTGSADALTFKLPRGAARKGINAVRVTLTAMDLYNVDFLKIGRGFSLATVATAENVYADNLQAIFTEETGLYLSL